MLCSLELPVVDHHGAREGRARLPQRSRAASRAVTQICDREPHKADGDGLLSADLHVLLQPARRLRLAPTESAAPFSPARAQHSQLAIRQDAVPASAGIASAADSGPPGFLAQLLERSHPARQRNAWQRDLRPRPGHRPSPPSATPASSPSRRASAGGASCPARTTTPPAGRSRSWRRRCRPAPTAS